VLCVLAETDAAGMRTDRHAELRREQDDCEHFVDPVRVVHGRYLAPTTPGYSIEIRPESLSEFAFPDGPGWWQEEEVPA